MLLSSISTIFWALVLASSAIAAPGKRPVRPSSSVPAVGTPPGSPGPAPPAGSPANERPYATLGYRACSEEQALDYNERNMIVDGWNATKLRGGKQLGTGVYTTPAPNEWGRAVHRNWHCIIQGYEDVLKTHPKVWVPRNYFWKNDTDLSNWGRASFPQIEDWSQAFLMSEIDGMVLTGKNQPVRHKHTMQLLIPEAIAANEELQDSMGLRIRCWKDWRQIPVRERVNYNEAWDPSSVSGISQWRDPSTGSGCFGLGCWRRSNMTESEHLELVIEE